MPPTAQSILTGFRAVSNDAELIQRAANALLATLDDARQAAYHPILLRLIADGEWDQLFDSFYQVMPFGTGGRRGPVGIGPNRINPFTITQSVQGHVNYLRERFPEGDLSVVVAFDVRRYQDLRGLYPKDLDNPLLGLTSRDLARMSAEVYAANGVKVHMWDPAGEVFPSTPELSFAIRRLGAHGGLNVSASHNHPDDNGGKFYNDRGGQEVPPHDEAMVDAVEKVGEIRTRPFAGAVADGTITLLGPELREAYLSLNLGLSRDPAPAGSKVVFTNLHGVGDGTTGALLERAGFEVHFVDSQRAHDGSFPGVPFQAPNPEIPASMQAGCRLADEVGATLVLSCDPDADRIGAMCKDTRDGSWRFLVGNELSCIVCAYLLEAGGDGRVVVRTEVTTSLFDTIAEAAGASTVSDLMVGCKYIARVIEQLEAKGELGRYLMGTEESHGFLLTPHIRDKDGAGVGLLLAQLAAREAAGGGSLVTYLEGLYARYGYVYNTQLPLVMRGAAGRARIVGLQQELRQAPPTAIGGFEVEEFLDRQDPQGPLGPIVSETDRASRDVLVFHLAGGHRVIIRPSGTEPKTKIYMEIRGEALGAGASPEALSAEGARCADIARRVGADFVDQALGTIGMKLPPAALFINGLVEVGDRLDFIEAVLPELRSRAGKDAPAALRAWLDGRIKGYGKDARELVRAGFEAWLLGIPEGERAELKAIYG